MSTVPEWAAPARGAADRGSATVPARSSGWPAAPEREESRGVSTLFQMRCEEALNMLVGLAGRHRAMDRLAQRGAVRQTDGELADQLLELVERQPLGHLGQAHGEITQQQVAFIGGAGLERLLAAPQLGDL